MNQDLIRPALSVGDPVSGLPFSSLAEAIASGVEQFPDGGFLCFEADGQRAEVSYRETLARARRLVCALTRRGMRPGDALVICLADARDFVPALWAAAIGGYVAVPFSRAARSGGVVDVDGLSALKQALAGLHVLADEPGLGKSLGLVVFSIAEIDADPGLSDIGMAAARPEDTRFAIPTSGTTGRPRLVGLSDRASLCPLVAAIARRRPRAGLSVMGIVRSCHGHWACHAQSAHEGSSRRHAFRRQPLLMAGCA